MSYMFCPLSPGKGAALTTLTPSKTLSAMANSQDRSLSHSHVQPCKPQESQLEQLSGTKMMLLLSLHLLKSLPPTFGSHFLHFFSLLFIPQEYNSAPRKSNTRAVQPEESFSCFSWMTCRIRWARKQSSFRAWSNSESAPTACCLKKDVKTQISCCGQEISKFLRGILDNHLFLNQAPKSINYSGRTRHW